MVLQKLLDACPTSMKDHGSLASFAHLGAATNFRKKSWLMPSLVFTMQMYKNPINSFHVYIWSDDLSKGPGKQLSVNTWRWQFYPSRYQGYICYHSHCSRIYQVCIPQYGRLSLVCLSPFTSHAYSFKPISCICLLWCLQWWEITGEYKFNCISIFMARRPHPSSMVWRRTLPSSNSSGLAPNQESEGIIKACQLRNTHKCQMFD